MVRENAKTGAVARAAARNDEAAIEHADRECRGRWAGVVVAEQFIEALALAFIVAENDRRHAVAHETLELLVVAVHRLGIAKREDDVWLLFDRISKVDGGERPEFFQRRANVFRLLEQLVAVGNVITASAGELDVMLRVIPRALEFRFDMRISWDDEQRVRRKERSDRAAIELAHVVVNLPIHRQDEREIHGATRALRVKVEVAQVDDLVAPKLRAHRLGHAERVNVEDAAANAELRNVFDHRHALETDRLEMCCQFTEAMRIAFAQLDAQLVEGARHPRLLEQGARRR